MAQIMSNKCLTIKMKKLASPSDYFATVPHDNGKLYDEKLKKTKKVARQTGHGG